MKASMIIKNGRVIDCYSHTDEIRDIAVAEDTLVDMDEVSDAAQIIDASGCIVTPGLIDFHGHTFASASDLAVYPEAQCFPTGVTTIVDAGSSGCANYEAFRTFSMYCRVRQYAYLHVNPAGIPTVKYPEQHDPAFYDEDRMLALLRKYPDQLMGIKVRESRSIVGDLGVRPLLRAIEIAEKASVPVVCHVTDAPVPSGELAALFRRGDVFAHVYHGKNYTILGEDGHVLPEIWAARKRGVIFDAANGKSHFAFRIAEAAIADGFLPDIISTDITVYNHWTPGAAFSLPHTLSRYLTLGLSLPQIIECATVKPAAALGQEKELGSLAAGTCADIAIHRVVQHETLFTDPLGGCRSGSQLLKTELTIRGGKIVYRQIDF